MTIYARIAAGVVAELFETAGDIATMFHPSLIWVEAPGTVKLGDLYDGEAFSTPVAPAPTKSDLVAYAADKRWQVETGGITVNGATIDTSRESQAMITGAYTYSQAHPSELIRFKAASGWTTLDAPTLAAIATAVGAHVQSCFAVEETVDGAIEAGTIKTIAAIDAADWP